VTVEIKQTWLADRFSRLFGKAPAIVIEEVSAGLTEGSALLEREVIERTPTSGVGNLRNSIGALPVTLGGGSISAGAATSLAYALPVELGSKPHWAPIAPLIDWVIRRLAKHGDEAQEVARMVQFKIARKGTKGHHMFRDAGEAIQPQFIAMMEKALDRAQARIEGQPA